MKKKQLRKFIALFDRLPEAAGILSGKYDNDQTEKDHLSSKVGEAYLAIRDIVEDPELKFLTKVFDEIDDNLYRFHSCCDKYSKDLLSGFSGIAPFLSFSPMIDGQNNEDNCPVEEINYSSLYIASLSMISEVENSLKREEDLTVAENYILSCSRLLENFAESLDARCLRFDLDFFAIQDELNIYIQTNRDLEKLALSGYMDKVKMLVSKGKAKMALPGAPSQPLSLMQKNPSAELDTTDQNHSLTLESVFADPYQYDCIMQILVEKKLCQPTTFIWIDLKKGKKTFIANLLKYLHFQNYYKNRAGLSNLQIQQIALNSFHVDIALDTIKHAELRDSNLKFIPEASTIKENRLKIASGE